MIIKKLLRTLLFFSLLGSAVFVFTWGGFENKYCASNISIADHKNNASKIQYSFGIKGGVANIFAESIHFKSMNTLELKKINGVYTTKNKQITLDAGECTYSINMKIAHLKNNIIIKSPDMIIKTEKATIDVDKQTIQSSSETFGSSNNIDFICSGFVISKNGTIKLVNAKTCHKNSKYK